MKLDKTDLKILNILQNNARITNQEMADTIALSPSSCLQRVRKLEQAKTIRHYKAHLNLNVLCQHVMCIATVSLQKHNEPHLSAFQGVVADTPEVVECYQVSGQYDFFLRTICTDLKHYRELINRLLGSDQFEATIQTHVVLEDTKVDKGVHIDQLYHRGVEVSRESV